VSLYTSRVNMVACVLLPVGALATMPDLSKINAQSVIILATLVVGAWNARQASKIKATGEAVHLLSNSAMAAQLTQNVQFSQAIAVLAHRIAKDSQQEGDLAAAAAADLVVLEQKKLLQEHLIKQAKVDATSAG
jgi:hypothetical protein